MEKKQKIILGAIIAIILIAAILLIIFWPSDYNRVYNKQYTDCTEQNKDTYFTLMAKRTSDEIYCTQNNKISEKCLAFATKNPQLYCIDIEDEKSMASCYAEVLQEASKCPADDNWCLAFSSGDPKFCDRLTEIDVLECKRLLPQNAEYWISEEAEKECREMAERAANSLLEPLK